jgi:hypothetical protein
MGSTYVQLGELINKIQVRLVTYLLTEELIDL